MANITVVERFVDSKNIIKILAFCESVITLLFVHDELFMALIMPKNSPNVKFENLFTTLLA